MAKLNDLLRIGVFYDGHYFFNVSNYYGFWHDRKARISIDGLHKFIRKEISDATDTDMQMCQIVDAHYFRGRPPVQIDTEQRRLYNERMFDDILISANVVSHYLPLKTDIATGRFAEKGIDVWLALEAYELAMYKKFDVVVLVACDGDYVPLVRKLNTLGTQVMLISWDFEYEDDEGRKRITRTSQQLLDEVTYPIAMHEVIDSRTNKSNTYVRDLFVQSTNQHFRRPVRPPYAPTIKEDAKNESTILNIIDRGEYKFGFIKGTSSDSNVYFTESVLVNCDIDELDIGMKVAFDFVYKDDGSRKATKVIRV